MFWPIGLDSFVGSSRAPIWGAKSRQSPFLSDPAPATQVRPSPTLEGDELHSDEPFGSANYIPPPIPFGEPA
jgi:hypothetical protein